MPPEGEEGRTHAVLDYVDHVLDYVDLVLSHDFVAQIHSPKPTVHPMNNEDSPILLAIFLVDFPCGTCYTGLQPSSLANTNVFYSDEEVERRLQIGSDLLQRLRPAPQRPTPTSSQENPEPNGTPSAQQDVEVVIPKDERPHPGMTEGDSLAPGESPSPSHGASPRLANAEASAEASQPRTELQIPRHSDPAEQLLLELESGMAFQFDNIPDEDGSPSVVLIPTNGVGQSPSGRRSSPLTEEEKVAVGVAARVLGPKTAGELFGMHQAQASYYGQGRRTQLDAQGNTQHVTDEKLAGKIEAQTKAKKAEIVDAALDKLLVSIGMLNEETIPKAKGRNIANVAANLSRVADKMTPKANANPYANVQLLVYAPQLKKETSYDVVKLPE